MQSKPFELVHGFRELRVRNFTSNKILDCNAYRNNVYTDVPKGHFLFVMNCGVVVEVILILIDGHLMNGENKIDKTKAFEVRNFKYLDEMFRLI